MGLLRDFAHLPTGAGFRNHPQNGSCLPTIFAGMFLAARLRQEKTQT